MKSEKREKNVLKRVLSKKTRAFLRRRTWGNCCKWLKIRFLRGGYTLSVSYKNFRLQGENFWCRFAAQHPKSKGERKTYLCAVFSSLFLSLSG
ncbi:MAG: hypothetical protein J5605_03495, partial [Bacteroidales bacterium]|nr:hypothetical protein [Bacteroidales bacterium]